MSECLCEDCTAYCDEAGITTDEAERFEAIEEAAKVVIDCSAEVVMCRRMAFIDCAWRLPIAILHQNRAILHLALMIGKGQQ